MRRSSLVAVLTAALTVAFASTASAQTGTSLQAPDIPETDVSPLGFGQDVDIDGKRVVVGLPGAKDPAVAPLEGPFSLDVRTGVIAVYWDGSTTPTALLRPPPSGIEGVVLAGFGEHVELSGNTIATTAAAVDVGQYYSPTIAVYLLVYERAAEGWRLQSQTEIDQTPLSLALEGELLALGNLNDSSGQGLPGDVDVYQRDQADRAVVRQVATLTAGDVAPGDYDTERFGESVSIGGDVIAVGAPSAGVNEQFQAGRTLLFTRNGADARSWRRTAVLTASDPAMFDEFGQSVDVGEEFVAIASGSRDRGAAYLFTRTGTFVAKLLAPNIRSIGVTTTVAIEGPRVVLGVNGLDQDGQFLLGSVRQFNKASGRNAWTLAATLGGPGGNNSFSTGFSLALDDGRAVAGAPDSGGVNVFTLR